MIITNIWFKNPGGGGGVGWSVNDDSSLDIIVLLLHTLHQNLTKTAEDEHSKAYSKDGCVWTDLDFYTGEPNTLHPFYDNKHLLFIQNMFIFQWLYNISCKFYE